MLHPQGDQARIDAGKSVLIVGFTANAPFDREDFCRTMPEIVLAGRLIEPYVPGQALLLAPGPMAGSVRPRGFAHLAFNGPSGVFVALRHKHLDERGAYMYAAAEDADSCDTAAILGVASKARLLEWPDAVRFAKAVVSRVALAYRQLDVYDRAAIRI